MNNTNIDFLFSCGNLTLVMSMIEGIGENCENIFFIHNVGKACGNFCEENIRNLLKHLIKLFRNLSVNRNVTRFPA